MNVPPPFSEQEKRDILAEALKKSNIPVERLLAVLNESGIQPNWFHMVPPHGRSMQNCIDVYESLRSFQRSPYPSLPPPPAGISSNKRKSASELEHLMNAPSPKRRHSGQDNPPSARDIRPKPSSSNGSPLLFTPIPGPSAPERKKRGRPSKADVELRQQEAIARGEVLPPPKNLGPKLIKPSVREEPGRTGFAMIAPMGATGPPPTEPSMVGEHYQAESPGGVDSPGKKKRVRTPARPKQSRISDLLESDPDEAPQKGPKYSPGSPYSAPGVNMAQTQQPQEQQRPSQSFQSQSFASEPQPIRPRDIPSGVQSMTTNVQIPSSEQSRGPEPPPDPPAEAKS